MAGNHRFLYNNLLDSATIVASNPMPGVLSGLRYESSGSALIVPSGTYVYSDSLLYTINIHNIDLGQEVGEAKYRWRTNLTATGTWEAANILTHSTNSLLNHAISIRFTTGADNDFEMNDLYQFRALANWGTQHLLDWRRDTFWANDSLPGTLTFDLGAATRIRACVLQDHDTATSVILQGNFTDSWVAPAYTTTITDITDPMVIYLDQTFRYWQLKNPNAGTSWSIGTLYLGDYLEFTRNASRGSNVDHRINMIERENPLGVYSGTALSSQRIHTLLYRLLTDTEFQTFLTMRDSLYNIENGVMSPLFFHFHHDETNSLIMARLLPEIGQNREGPNLNTTTLILQETVKS